MVRSPSNLPPWFEDLQEAMQADGYELRGEHISARRRQWDPAAGKVRWQILPTDATPVPLASEITALEAELDARGLRTALNHYRQAVDNLRQHNYEATNSQLRSMLEDLVVTLAFVNGYVGHGKAGGGGPAIQYIVDQAGLLPPNEGGLLLRGLWAITHTNGSHPGQSDASEARFRMQLITGMAQFLLKRFPPRAT